MELIKTGYRRRDNPIISKKYYLNYCQENVLNDKNTRDWLIAQNIIISQKVVQGLLHNKMKVVIKIGQEDSISREYKINKQLRQLKQLYKGFTRYICFFSCKDNLDKYQYPNGEWSTRGFCETDGKNQTYSIIMPYYELGSMFSYKWTRDNFKTFKQLIKQVLSLLIFVNKDIGFLHNDVHLENIMLKSKNGILTPYLIDFELSTIDDSNKINYKKLGQNFRKLFSDFIAKTDFINNNDVNECINYTNKMRDPFETEDTLGFNLGENCPLFELVDNLRYDDRFS